MEFMADWSRAGMYISGIYLVREVHSAPTAKPNTCLAEFVPSV